MLGFTDYALAIEVIYFGLVGGCRFLAPFAEDVVKGRGIALLYIDIARFQRLVREGIVEEASLRDNVLYVEVLAEQLILRDVGI